MAELGMRFVEKALRVLLTVRLYHLPEKSRLIGAAGLSSARSVRQTRLYQIFPSIPKNSPGAPVGRQGGGVIRCAGRPREWSCGSVPPQERTARGVLVFFGDCSGVGVCVDHGSGHAVPCRLRRGRHEGFWFSLGTAPVLVCVLTTGVVMRFRAASGEDGTRGFGFLWGLLRCWCVC